MLYYQIALTNVPFDNSYKNVIHFEDRSEQETFFNVSSLFSSSTPNVNFNVGSLYATNVSFDGIPTDSINELLSKNYCIIKDNSPNKTLSYYYYFVTEARQDNGERLLLSLELDIFQTYYIDITFGDCLINKAHLNRFIEKTGDATKVIFDGSVNSKLFEREDVQNVAKILKKRTKMSFYQDNEFGNWLNANVLGWVYVYVEPVTYNEDFSYSENFKFYHISNELNSVNVVLPNTKCVTQNGFIPLNTSILTFPIMKLFSRIQLDNGDNNRTFYWGETMTSMTNTLDLFATQNKGYTRVYSVKISPYPPQNINLTSGYTIINPTLGDLNTTLKITVNNGPSSNSLINPMLSRLFSLLNGYTSSYGNTLLVQPALQNKNLHVMCSLDNYEQQKIPQKYTVGKQFEFLKTDIIGANKNTNFNPKLLSNDYFSLKISDNTENGFDYDLQKLNNNSLEIQYSVSKTPDTAKSYLRFKDSGLYANGTEEALIGYIGTDDNSIALPTTAYQSMLANNKNYFLQNLLGQAGNAENAVMGIAKGNPTQTFNAVNNIILQGISNELTIDNIKNSPASITQAKGNIYFQSMYSKNGVIVEEWDILDNEKEMINDYMCMFGYAYNRIDNIKNVDNIRKYYNYVRADVETIAGTTVNISEKVHLKFKELFARGVRFWNIVNNEVNFSYAKENYEKWLEE